MKPPLLLSERDLTKQIRDWLNLKRIFHWKHWSGLGSAPGVPDILGVLPGGRALMIEVKTMKGKLSDHQRRFLENAANQGALAFEARSLEDVIKRCRPIVGEWKNKDHGELARQARPAGQ